MSSNRKRPLPPLDIDRVRKTPGKKDTKQWCKGKVGREHVTAWQPHAALGHCEILTCLCCGKQFTYRSACHYCKKFECRGNCQQRPVFVRSRRKHPHVPVGRDPHTNAPYRQGTGIESRARDYRWGNYQQQFAPQAVL